jgi:hypothetical protein
VIASWSDTNSTLSVELRKLIEGLGSLYTLSEFPLSLLRVGLDCSLPDAILPVGGYPLVCGIVDQLLRAGASGTSLYYCFPGGQVLVAILCSWR